MGRALVCDNCGDSLPLKPNGDALNGENAAWLTISGGTSSWDVCSRSCAHVLLDGEIAAAVDEWTEYATGLARESNDPEEP